MDEEGFLDEERGPRIGIEFAAHGKGVVDLKRKEGAAHVLTRNAIDGTDGNAFAGKGYLGVEGVLDVSNLTRLMFRFGGRSIGGLGPDVGDDRDDRSGNGIGRGFLGGARRRCGSGRSGSARVVRVGKGGFEVGPVGEFRFFTAVNIPAVPCARTKHGKEHDAEEHRASAGTFFARSSSQIGTYLMLFCGTIHSF